MEGCLPDGERTRVEDRHGAGRNRGSHSKRQRDEGLHDCEAGEFEMNPGKSSWNTPAFIQQS